MSEFERREKSNFMIMEKEIILGVIVAKSNHYVSVPDTVKGSRIILDDVYRKYQSDFLSQIDIYKNRLINSPFILYADIFFLNERFDLDNACKTLLDLLQDAKAIKNDRLCVELHAKKHIDHRVPRVEFSIVELEPSLFSAI